MRNLFALLLSLILLSGCKEHKSGESVFLTAAVLGQTDRIQSILNEGVNVNQCDSNGNSALHLIGKVDMAKLLIGNGANIELRNSHGATPLCVTLNFGYIDVAKYYVEQGANIHIKSDTGLSILHYAALSDSVPCVEYALSLGIDVNIKDSTQTTPLCMAVESGCINSVVVLVNHGADIYATNFHNPLQADCISTAIFGSRGNIPNSKEILAFLLSKVDFRNKMPNGRYFIQRAIYMSYLFENGYIWQVIENSDINVVDDDGFTILDHMEKLKNNSLEHEKVYNYLVEKGVKK